MGYKRGDIVKEVWKEDNRIFYLLILENLPPLGLSKHRYHLYDISEGESSYAALVNSQQVEYTLFFRMPNG